MNQNISITSEMEVGAMADLGALYALSPLFRIGFKIDEEGIEQLANLYEDRIFRARQWAEEGKLTWGTLVLRFGDQLFAIAHGSGRNWLEIYAPSREEASALCKELQGSSGKPEGTSAPFFYMLRQDCGDFEVDRIEHLPPAVDDTLLRLCYGEAAPSWITDFAENTVERTGGITLFDGPPGTGKTSLVSQMIHRLAATHLFYVLPASQGDALSSPELVSFWQQQNARHGEKVKVMVLEDAERLLWQRGNDNRDSVSSLLNIADGLVGRMLRLHLLCSVNAPLDELDPAILRPGRLRNYRRFSPLDIETAKRLAEHQQIAFQPKEGAKAMTLAETLNPGGYTFPEETSRQIGYHATTIA